MGFLFIKINNIINDLNKLDLKNIESITCRTNKKDIMVIINTKNNIETEHEKMFSEQGIKIKALIAKMKQEEKLQEGIKRIKIELEERLNGGNEK